MGSVSSAQVIDWLQQASNTVDSLRENLKQSREAYRGAHKYMKQATEERDEARRLAKQWRDAWYNYFQGEPPKAHIFPWEDANV